MMSEPIKTYQFTKFISVTKEMQQDAGCLGFYTTGRDKERGIDAFFKRLTGKGGWRYYQTFHRAYAKQMIRNAIQGLLTGE